MGGAWAAKGQKGGKSSRAWTILLEFLHNFRRLGVFEYTGRPSKGVFWSCWLGSRVTQKVLGVICSIWRVQESWQNNYWLLWRWVSTKPVSLNFVTTTKDPTPGGRAATLMVLVWQSLPWRRPKADAFCFALNHTMLHSLLFGHTYLRFVILDRNVHWFCQNLGFGAVIVVSLQIYSHKRL